MSLDIRSESTQGPGPISVLPTTHRVCAECRFAELFAVQPRARCTHPASLYSGKVLFVGQQACDDVAVHPDRMFRLSVYGASTAAFIGGLGAAASDEPRRMCVGADR